MVPSQMCLERSGRLWTLDGLFTPDDEVLQSMDLGVDVSSPPHSSARAWSMSGGLKERPAPFVTVRGLGILRRHSSSERIPV